MGGMLPSLGILAALALYIILLSLVGRWIHRGFSTAFKPFRDIAMGLSDLNDRLGRIEEKLEHLSKK